MRNPTSMGGRDINPNDIKQGAFAKRTDKKYILKRLWKYLGRWKLIIALSLLFVFASNILALFGPDLSGKAIDAMLPGGTDFGTVFHYAWIMIACYAASGILSYLLSVLMTRLSKNVTAAMRRDVFERLSALPVSFFDKHQAGDIISVISYDIDTVNTSLSNDLLQIAKSAITVIGSIAMMLIIAPKLMLVFLITVPASLLFTRYTSRKVRPMYRKRSAKLGAMNGFAEEMIGGQKTTRALNAEDSIISRFDVKNAEAVEAYTDAECFATLMGPSVNFINNISLALVSVFGALMFIAGQITPGQIGSFVLYSRKFSGPINEAANIFGELQSAFAAAERVSRLIDELPEKPDAADAGVLRDVYGDVLIKDVEFGYVPERTIIKNFNLDAKKGNLIAIVGPTGAGKTTIINLLMRFYDVDKGEICIDGTNIYNVTRDSLRRAYTMVLQDTWLFSGTIFDNIAYGKEGATMDEVVAAAKAARMHSFIMRLPDGYNTVLSDNATNISKGQKQLLTIARAMLLDSEMLILDEATSNVDTQTERLIQAAMRKLMQDRTCFVIAHRLSTISNADLILVMKDGNIIEQGTHEQLLEKKGFYSELYYSQFETY